MSEKLTDLLIFTPDSCPIKTKRLETELTGGSFETVPSSIAYLEANDDIVIDLSEPGNHRIRVYTEAHGVELSIWIRVIICRNEFHRRDEDITVK